MGSQSEERRLYLPGNAWVLALSAAVWSLGGSIASPYQSVFFHTVGATPIFIGFLMAVSSALTALAQLVGGYVADRWGRKKVIVVFSFVSAASAWVYIFIDRYQLLILPVMLASVAGIYGPAFSALLSESMRPELRAKGVASFTLVSSLPSVFCPYIGGFLMTRFGTLPGLRIAYFVSGLLGVIGVSYRAVRLEETYAGNGVTREGRLRDIILDTVNSYVEAAKQMSSGARRLLAYSLTASAGSGMTASYASLYVIETLQVQAQFYGLLTNMAGIVNIIFLFASTALVKRAGLRKTAIYASLSVPVGQFIFVRSKGMNDLATWTVLGAAGSAFLGPSIAALQADLTPKEARGRLMALFSFFPLVLAIPAQILGGYLYENVNPLAPFLASLPIFVLAAAILVGIKEPESVSG